MPEEKERWLPDPTTLSHLARQLSTVTITPPVQNVNDLHSDRLSVGQRVADRVATVIGGWRFIITQTCILVLWIAANTYLVMHYREKSFDPYPFILLNLVLSFQAAYTGPIVMMSQNRQNEKDRLAAQSDYECNLRAEEEVRVIMEHLVYQDQMLDAIQARLGLKATLERSEDSHGLA